jgi:D-proline reductase (dithiol) PrdB
VALAARHLEANGIPAVVFGCARDIVEHCGVARFIFSDFPLGNPTGKPWDVPMQRAIVGLGLDLLESAGAPVTVTTSYRWGSDETWKVKCFTKERPFLSVDATEKWLRRKAAYRGLKAEGKV